MDYLRQAQDFLSTAGIGDPDAIYEPGSTTFLFYQGEYAEAPHPVYHQSLFYKNRDMVRAVRKKLRKIGAQDDEISRDLMVWAGVLVGRLAHVDGWYAVMFWNPKVKDADLYECIHELVQNHPEVAASPERTVIFSTDEGNFPTKTLLDFGFRPTGKPVERPQDEPPECSKINPVIDGRPYPLNTMMGDLHMVRGERLARHAGQFCGQIPQLRSQADRLGCKNAGDMIDHLDRAFKCGGDPKAQWDRALRDGRVERKQWLRWALHPDNIDAQFRSQAEIDAAWKELMGEGFGVFMRTALNEWLYRRGRTLHRA